MASETIQSEFTITGMHCQGCVTKISAALTDIPGVTDARVTLNPPSAAVTRTSSVHQDELRNAVRSAGDYDLAPSSRSANGDGDGGGESQPDDERQESLFPLLLIIGFITGVTVLVAIRAKAFLWTDMMGNFMAGFFLVFGFFKLLDLRGFVQTYRTYDLLAMALPLWAWAYPFIEVLLGCAYLLGIAPMITNLLTLAIMLIGAVGVGRALANKQRIRCACLGTALNLPMTTVTLAEDLVMAMMAGIMLLSMVS